VPRQQFKTEEIIQKLREAEVLRSSDPPPAFQVTTKSLTSHSLCGLENGRTPVISAVIILSCVS